MTPGEFNDLLSSIRALSPAQMRQLRQELDSELVHDSAHVTRRRKKPPGRTSAKGDKRAKAPARHTKKPLTEAEFDQHLLRIGLMSELPDTAADFDDPADEPIPIKGEPLSETVIRERCRDGGLLLR
jgi:hypothetical protein